MKAMSNGRFPGMIGLCLVLFLAVSPATARAAGKNPPAKVKVDTNALPRELKATSFAPVIKKVAPSVVNIYSSKTLRARQGANPLFRDPFWRRFFGGDDPGSDQRQPRARREQSLGSGVIITTDGYILTASHVVEGADEVKVSLSTGEQEFSAKVIGTDPPTDIAVLKLDAKKELPAVTLANDQNLEVGDVVLAMGNPFGVGQTVTMGIVSAMERGGFGISGYENFIQTDAAINPGNSGGALVDAAGRLVGINTAIISGSGGFMGVGFAVPASMAHYVMDQLISEGKVNRGYLGISIQPLTPELAKEFNLPDESSGVLVGGVSPNGAAAKAGLKEGDVILEVNGKKVTEPRTLQLAVAQTPPGSKATIRILRGQRGQKSAEKTLTAVLGTLPQNALAGRDFQNEDGSGQAGTDALDGVEVSDLDAQTRQQFRIPNNIRGALVVNVDPESNSAEAGVRPGDVILQIDRQPVRSAEDAVNLSEKAKDDTILLQVWSRSGNGPGGTHFLTVKNKKE